MRPTLLCCPAKSFEVSAKIKIHLPIGIIEVNRRNIRLSETVSQIESGGGRERERGVRERERERDRERDRERGREGGRERE